MNAAPAAAASAQLRAAIATLRDPARSKAQRALAATMTGAAFTAGAAAFAAAAVPPSGPESRMYAYGVRHPDAQPWDGRSTRSGTITYVDDERIEQYIGQQHWLTYSPEELGRPGFVVGDQIRVARRAGALAIEAIGNNRLAGTAPARVGVRSGLAVYRTLAIEPSDVAAAAASTAQRYGAAVDEQPAWTEIVFAGTARLRLAPCSSGWAEAEAFAGEPLTAAVRLEVEVAADDAPGALVAESALVHCAALLANARAGGAIAIDDSGAFLAPEVLYDLALSDATRAELFAIAAAAAQRAWPALPVSVAGRAGVADELTICWAREWHARYASAAVRRALEALGDARSLTGDPVVPAQGVVFDADDSGDAHALRPLVRLEYDTVAVDIAYLDVAAETAAAAAVRAREDVALLLGAAPQSALVLSFGSRSDELAFDAFALEMRRADALVTALAAAIARRGTCIAFDGAGVVFCADELTELALHRRGKASSWRARAARHAVIRDPPN